MPRSSGGHSLRDQPREHHGGAIVDVDGLRQLVRVALQEAPSANHARVVHQHVDAAEVRRRFYCHLSNLVQVRQVRWNHQGTAFTDLGGNRFQCVAVAGHERHRGASLTQPKGDLAADTA